MSATDLEPDISEAAPTQLDAADGRIEAIALDLRGAVAAGRLVAAQRPRDGICNRAGVVHDGTIPDGPAADRDRLGIQGLGEQRQRVVSA